MYVYIYIYTGIYVTLYVSLYTNIFQLIPTVYIPSTNCHSWRLEKVVPMHQQLLELLIDTPGRWGFAQRSWFYPLVMTDIAMENHHVLMEKSTISMVIFHSYVKLPEGRWKNIKCSSHHQAVS